MESTLIPADTNDDTCIRLWLHNRSPHTQRAYARDLDGNKLAVYCLKPE